jgi:hypothetical protein
MERRFEYYVLELACNLVFTIEISLRLLAAPSRLRFLKGFANIIDIVAIVPFWTAILINQLNIFSLGSSASAATSNQFTMFNYATYRIGDAISSSSTPTSTPTMSSTLSSLIVSMSSISYSAASMQAPSGMSTLSTVTPSTTSTRRPHGNQYGLSVLRVLRLTRVLRVLKLSRHIHALNIMGKILYECMYEIILLLTFLAMNIVIFSSFMYYIELQALGDASPFISIPHSFWWAVISFTTIGYGIYFFTVLSFF